jgi:hypothetical protein
MAVFVLIRHAQHRYAAHALIQSHMHLSFYLDGVPIIAAFLRSISHTSQVPMMSQLSLARLRPILTILKNYKNKKLVSI